MSCTTRGFVLSVLISTLTLVCFPSTHSVNVNDPLNCQNPPERPLFPQCLTDSKNILRCTHFTYLIDSLGNQSRSILNFTELQDELAFVCHSPLAYNIWRVASREAYDACDISASSAQLISNCSACEGAGDAEVNFFYFYSSDFTLDTSDANNIFVNRGETVYFVVMGVDGSSTPCEAGIKLEVTVAGELSTQPPDVTATTQPIPSVGGIESGASKPYTSFLLLVAAILVVAVHQL